MKRRGESAEGDLFATAADPVGGHGANAMPADWTSQNPPAALIESPMVDDARTLLKGRTTALGSLLASERAVEYVACLKAFVDFRDSHEPEPLHEDLEAAVCGEDASSAARAAFKADIRQLKEWGLVDERIEKERLRGYRDTRRTKFRYRLCDDAAAFLEWLKERRAHDLDPSGGEETGNLLEMQCSLLAELRRKVRKVSPGIVDYDTASHVLYRVDRMARNVAATAKTLQELNLRLLAFGAAEFVPDEARAVVEELGFFLERFGLRFGEMREDILRDIVELRRDCHAARWKACAAKLEEESRRMRRLASVRVPDAPSLLADAEEFYGADGKLIGLMARVGESARKVWGRLNAKLRELERRNHRLEDLGARLGELAVLMEDEVPHGWMRRLVEAANMHGDAQIRPAGEKSSPPKPKVSSVVAVKRTPEWIVPRKVGERPDVASIAKVKAEKLREWMVACAIYPEESGKRPISSGTYCDFGDFHHLIDVIEQVRLASGAKGRALLGVAGECTGNAASISIENASMTFDDIALRRAEDDGVISC